MKLTEKLEWQKVESSQIDSVAHDEQGLFVKFISGGSIYGYPEVPKATFDQMLTAESVGKFLNSQIKPNYAYERLN